MYFCDYLWAGSHVFFVNCVVLPSKTERPVLRCEHLDGCYPYGVIQGTRSPGLSFLYTHVVLEA